MSWLKNAVKAVANTVADTGKYLANNIGAPVSFFTGKPLIAAEDFNNAKFGKASVGLVNLTNKIQKVGISAVAAAEASPGGLKGAISTGTTSVKSAVSAVKSGSSFLSSSSSGIQSITKSLTAISPNTIKQAVNVLGTDPIKSSVGSVKLPSSIQTLIPTGTVKIPTQNLNPAGKPINPSINMATPNIKSATSTVAPKSIPPIDIKIGGSAGSQESGASVWIKANKILFSIILGSLIALIFLIIWLMKKGGSTGKRKPKRRSVTGSAYDARVRGLMKARRARKLKAKNRMGATA